MTLSTPSEPQAPEGAGGRASLARRRPLTAFLLLVFGIGGPALVVPAVAGLPFEPFLLVLVYVGLLGSSLLVSRWADGPGAARRLLSRALLWRLGLGRWAVILLGMPLLTLGLAAGTGTLQTSERGWPAAAVWYLVDVLVVGVLVLNLWEETAWGGFAQSRLMARHGLLVGSLATAVPFAAIHVPLLFETGWTWPDVGLGLLVLFGAAPFYRYLLGMHLLDTGGSLLAIAVQHAAWNTAGRMEEVRGEWQVVAAVGLLTALVALHRRFWHPASRAIGRDAERAEAARWTASPQRAPS